MSLLYQLWVAFGIYLFLVATAAAGTGSSPFTFLEDGGDGFQLAGPGVTPEIRVAPDEHTGVIRAANDLAMDFGRVLGTNATVITANWNSTVSSAQSRPIILIGTAGHSGLVDNLASSGKLDTTPIKDKWETFSYQIVSAPWQGRDAVLAVSGSDMRGTIFGIYDISERIGVSPWYWWADVAPTKRQYIYAQNPAVVQGPPSVKFRGIFFNDESPCLTSWGGANFKSSQYGSPFVTDFYKRVFELVLRMKANYVWPAMWSSMFYLDDSKNGPTATEYGVYMGTSHHEPMARADKEQSRFMKGSWDWRSNKANVQSFMQEGATRSKNWSTVYTLGMRGSGDAASATLTSSALEEVIQWQQSTLSKTLGRDLSTIPQAWVMYKEVPGYWQNGMKVSDDVTLLWTDDNRGNIRRIPIANETTRRGGSGMYYHFDYVGDPRNYKWINSIQLTKTWEQMSLGYERGIRNIWIANVGDLKGLELPTSHFLAMAWDMSTFADPSSTTQWLSNWAARQFGEAAAANTSSIMTTYGKLTARRKYEDLSTSFGFSTSVYDEAERNYNEWTSILDRAQSLYDSLPSAVQPSFFETVLHPVLAGKTVYEIYTKAALSSKYANEHRVSANKLANDVKTAFANDAAITKRYHSLLNGKWNHMMDQVHLGYNNWQDPGSNSMPRVTYVPSTSASKNAIMGVSVQGSTNFYPTNPTLTLSSAINPYTPEEPRLEIFARDNGTFSYTITSNVSYVSVTDAEGTVTAPGDTSDIRCFIRVDWDAAPMFASVAALTIKNINASGGSPAVVYVPLYKFEAPPDFEGHVESGGVVSIEAAHHDANSGAEYKTIPDYGRTLSGVRFHPMTDSQKPAAGPVLIFPFYTLSNTTAASLTVYLSSSENSNPTSPNRYSFSIDGASPTTVQPVPVANAGSEPSGWSTAVIENAWVKSTKFGSLAAGKHELKLWLLEPTMVLTKLVIDVGGLKSSALGPPESKVIS